MKYRHPNHSNTAGHHGQCTYLMQTHQRWCLSEVVSVYVAHAQNSYYFRIVVTCATFGLLTVIKYLESSNILE